jgi:hypothetical protein
MARRTDLQSRVEGPREARLGPWKLACGKFECTRAKVYEAQADLD